MAATSTNLDRVLKRTVDNDPCLIRLRIESLEFKDRQALILAAALSTNTNLKQIYFIKHAMTVAGIKSLAKALESNTTIQRFRFKNVERFTRSGIRLMNSYPLHDIPTRLAFGIFMNMLQYNKTLKYIDLQGFNVDEGSDILREAAAAISKNHTLSSLKLKWNRNSMRRGQDLGLFLNSLNSCVITLNLSAYYLHCNGLYNLCEWLKTNKTLKHLYVHKADYSYNTINLLVDALKENNTLESLDVSRSHLDDDDFKLLAKFFEINKNIKNLNLAGNRIYNQATWNYICNIIRKNTSLLCFYVFPNYLNAKSLKLVESALKHNNTIGWMDAPKIACMYEGKQAVTKSKITTLLAENRAKTAVSFFEEYENISVSQLQIWQLFKAKFKWAEYIEKVELAAYLGSNDKVECTASVAKLKG